MGVSDVKIVCEATRTKLKEVTQKLEFFLNSHTLAQLNTGNEPAMEEFYQGYVSDTRHLLVFSEVSCEKIGVALRRPTLNADFAERILYDVYHNCVNSFFYPKNECYSEDGRYAYTGQDAIRFRKKPCREVRDLTLELSKIFEELREDLTFYETDYVTQKKMSGERI